MYETAIAFSLLCWLVVGFYYIRSPISSAFHPFSVYLAFHGFLFVIWPILAYFLQFTAIYGFYSFTPSISDKITVMLASNLGFLVFAFACLRAGAVEMRFKQDNVVSAERQRLMPIFMWTVRASCNSILDDQLASGQQRRPFRHHGFGSP